MNLVGLCLPSPLFPACPRQVISDPEFLTYRPSVVAAAVLRVDRQYTGVVPPWPSSLQLLTGYADAAGGAGGAEMASAINAAHR